MIMVALHKCGIITVLAFTIYIDFILPTTKSTIITTAIATEISTSRIQLQNATYSMDNIQRTASSKIVSRVRRYLSFPEGSSFSVAVCSTVGVIGNPNPAYLSYGINWGVAYDLPNATWTLKNLYGFKNSKLQAPKEVIQRRTRRSLYNEIEFIFSSFGYNGRHCMLRTLCEVKIYFQLNGSGGTMIEEMLKALFSFPRAKVYSYEHQDIFMYDEIIRKTRSLDDCSPYYNDCNFSLLDLIFGKYSQSPDGYYWNN